VPEPTALRRASDLAAWASDPAATRGRRHAEVADPQRNPHQRDRDRIVHSTAFRRLVYKTQVFINHEGDLFRTRLTHSLEVAQLGRSAARALRLNEDLVEAIALAHDLGHTPFGHAGQDALAACMHGHGGFEHNLQSLRVVDTLEVRYPDFDGLNLSFETREGILKHCSQRAARALLAADPQSPARRFVDLADQMAYHAHDIDDGVRSGLLTLAQLDEVPFFARCRAEAVAAHPGLVQRQGRRLLFTTLRRMLALQMADLVRATGERLQASAPADADAVRKAPTLVQFGSALRRELDTLSRFLFDALYRHPQVRSATERAGQVVDELYAAYLAAPQEMPAEYTGSTDPWRAVADYIAGMTDRFALREHHRLTGRRLFDEGLPRIV
jgi:dGTPase